MDKLIESSMAVLDTAANVIPKMQLKGCAGIILISSREVGFGASYQAGAGVLVSHLNGKWSAPVAVSLGSVGLGAVLGAANKQLAIVLNPLAMRSLVESKGSIQFGGTLGLTIKKGVEGGADVSVANHGTAWASSIVYTFSEGLMITAQLETGSISFIEEVNEKYYKTKDPSEILEGLASIPPGPAAQLVKRLTLLTNGASTD
jgi:lipid-binding SYLF domain-containing protein|mmetsp:Transcript_25161/g.45441  ORF Transcript_25161/g.45441 Transcript_25161/m.45441 type:complete len:203 (-) Transcript_25161:58-666(-)